MLIPETEIIVSKDGTEILRKTVRPGDYVIGSDSACEVQIDAESVSRRHAQLTVNYDHTLIEDLGSGHGTFVNGQRVTASTRLWPNQKIQLGAATVELHRIKTVPPPDDSLAPRTVAVQRLLPEEFLRDKKYDIGKVVAQGGMGAILEAREAAIERRVAMMLDGSSADDLTRFVAEAKITGQLEHPSIVPVYELSVDENGQVFYTMKMVRGITLRKVLELLAEGDAETVKKYPLPVLLTIFQKVCDALAFAHAKGVIHRDLKPENIMLDDFGVVLVMDWGLAKIIGKADATTTDVARSAVRTLPPEASGATVAGTIMGTPQYMSPEQARGEIETLDVRSDIYALGAILYHLLALRPPVTGRTAMEIVDKVGRGEAEPLIAAPSVGRRSSPPGGQDGRPTKRLPGGRIAGSLAAVVRKAMSFNRDERYPQVGDLQRDIEAYQSGRATKAENASVGKQLVLLVKRHKALFSTAAAAWLIITVLVVWFVIHLRASEHRASQALADLRGQAPAFAAMAETYIEQLNLPAALGKLDSAIQLDPNHAEYHARRGDVLQTLLRFAESATAYERARALGLSTARMEAAQALSSRLSTSVPDGKEPSAEEFNALHALLMEQQRLAEAVAITPKLTNAQKAQRRTFAARLKEMEPATPQKDLMGMFTPTEDGRYDVDLGNLRGPPALNGRHEHALEALRGVPLRSLLEDKSLSADLSPLAGQRIETLRLGRSNVTRVRDLRGMPLQWLSFTNTPLADLDGLQGCPLTYLDIRALNTTVTDYEVLRHLKLKGLNACHTSFADGDVLRGQPLEVLLLSRCAKLKDVSFLKDLPNLKALALPPELIQAARNLPGLQYLSTQDMINGETTLDEAGKTMVPVEKFWQEYDAQQAAGKK